MKSTAKTRKYFAALAAVACAGLAACSGLPGRIGADESFTVAWINANTANAVTAKNSKDGLKWSEVALPASVKTKLGPGIAADGPGIMHLIAVPDNGGNTIGIFGLGPNGYTIAKPEQLASAAQLSTDSAMALAAMDNERWYFAYRSSNSAKLSLLTRQANTATPGFSYAWSDQTPALSVNNTAVAGRPGVALLGNKIVMSWYRQTQTPELQIAVGALGPAGAVTWQGGYVFPYSHSGAGGVELAHDLTQDGNRFVLGVVRRDLAGSSQLANYSLYVYRSTDGQKWQLKTVLGKKSVGKSLRHASPLGLAAQSNGRLLAVQAGGLILSAYRHDGGAWADISNLFGSAYPLKNTHIAVINSGRP